MGFYWSRISTEEADFRVFIYLFFKIIFWCDFAGLKKLPSASMVVKTLRYVVISPLKLWCDCPLCRAQFWCWVHLRNFPPMLIYTSGIKRFEPCPSTTKLFALVYSWTQKKDLWTTLNPFLPFHDDPGFYMFISFSKKICCNEELALHVLEGFCTLFKRNLTGLSGAGVVTFVEGWICSCRRTFGGVLCGSKSCKATSYKDNLFWEFLCVPGNWSLHSRNCKTVSTGGCSCWLCRFVHSHWLIDCYLQLMIFLNWLIVECLILWFFVKHRHHGIWRKIFFQSSKFWVQSFHPNF